MQTFFCEKCGREKEFEKGVNIWRQRGQIYKVLVTSVSILCCGWRQSRRPAFNECCNMVPMSSHSSSWQIIAQESPTRHKGPGEIHQKDKSCPSPWDASSLVKMTSFMYIDSYPFFTFFKTPPQILPMPAALQYRLIAHASTLCPRKTHILHFYTIGTWQLCSLVDSCALSPTDLSVSWE